MGISIPAHTRRAAHLGNQIAHYRPIVEIEPAARGQLVILMSFAGDHDDIAGRRDS